MVPLWFDMQSAPRDGTRILLSRKQSPLAGRPLLRRVVIGRYNEAFSPKLWALETSTYHRDTDFDGWMPLPEGAA